MRWLLAVVFAAVPTAAVPVWACAHAAPSGLATRHVPGYGISIAVPSTWQGISPPASAAGAGLKYFYQAPEMVSGFSANLNLIVTPLPPGLTLREWLFSGASAAYQYIGTTTTITVDGVRGLHFETTKATRFGLQPLLTDEYAFVRKRHVFLFTYSALASTRGRYEGLFRASAESIRFSTNPLVVVTA